MTTKTQRPLKKQKLRNNEYYDIQNVFDDLYAKAKEGKVFKDLLSIITSEENVLLAYRNIKKNKGSKTRGTNKNTIVNMGEKEPQKLVEYVRFRLNNFRPHTIRRTEIDKENGDKRPLGIPTIEDRLIQQCIKQVMEPICEAKFHNHSYGFRPNRGTHHAIARALFLSNRASYHYVVDIDIKGFFDNVNHGKLLKQIYSIGIRDKNLLCIISKMLKTDIKGIGIPTCGVPQGGILSPLLSNIVLNELDWWISSQWETTKTRVNYSESYTKYGALRKTSNMKEVFIVRYADDFRLYCKSMNHAIRIFEATKKWLKERLGLEVNLEKSKVVNLKKDYSEFLGFKFKLRRKSNKWVIKSHISDKAIKKIKRNIKDKVKCIQHDGDTLINAMKFNSTVLGIHNYYKIATNVYIDFEKIAYFIGKSLKIRLRQRQSKGGSKSETFNKYYGDYKGKIYYVDKIALFPVSAVRTKPPMCFSQDMCNYTISGRNKIHNNLKGISSKVLRYLMENPIKGETTEYNDNRISLYVGQNGKCAITLKSLKIGEMAAHHKIPRKQLGSDSYDNLIFLNSNVHMLIHATDEDIISKYLDMVLLNKSSLSKVNKLRALVGNCKISTNK